MPLITQDSHHNRRRSTTSVHTNGHSTSQLMTSLPQPRPITASKLSDALASFSARNRSASTPPIPKYSPPVKENISSHVPDPAPWAVEPDPFASTFNGDSSFRTYPTPPASTSTLITDLTSSATPSVTTTNTNANTKKARGSLFLAASDALTFGRNLGASFSRRRSKTASEGSNLNGHHANNYNQGTSHPPGKNGVQGPRRQKGMLIKGHGKGKDSWALQPSHTSPPGSALPEVIEISAAMSGSANGSLVGLGRVDVRRSEEEDEQKERERLREAAAQSIGIGPLMLRGEDAGYSHSYLGDDSREGDEEDEAAAEDVEEDQTGENVTNGIPPPPISTKARSPISTPRDRSSIGGLSFVNVGSSILRSSTPTSTLGHTPIQTQKPALSPAQTHLPPFPCTYSALSSSVQLTSTLPKYYPSPSLLKFALTRQWRPRYIVLTAPPLTVPATPSTSHASPSYFPTNCAGGANGLAKIGNVRGRSGSISPSVSTPSPAAFHLHLFKSSSSDERELERLEINERSIVFVTEEEVAGRRAVVKVGGTDVGLRKRELNAEEDGRAMWFLQIVDPGEAQKWIAAIKNAVLVQRAERAGLGTSAHSPGAGEPRGDLDVILSMRAQGLIATSRAADSNRPTSSQSSSTHMLSEGARILDGAEVTTSPAPTLRSQPNESRSPSPPPLAPTPTTAVSALKVLFTGSNRPRSPSRSSFLQGEMDTTRDDNASFANRGNTLLNLLRSPTSAGGSASNYNRASAVSPPQSPLTPNCQGLPSAGISSMDVPIDRPITKDRDLQDWAPLDEQQQNEAEGEGKSDSPPLSPQQALQPPPRHRRPWTSSGMPKPEGGGRFLGQFRASYQGPPGGLSINTSENGGGNGDTESPVGSVGVFGTPEQRPRRASMSSSISSFGSAFAGGDPSIERSNSTGGQRRSRIGGKLPKMLTPPTGPPPSIPLSQSSPNRPVSSISERPAHPYATGRASFDSYISRSSSIQNSLTGDAGPYLNGLASRKRLSMSSALSVNTVSTTQSRMNNMRLFQGGSIPSKRASLPPPPRPAPTFALPPTPGHDTSILKQPESAPAKRTTFRESLTQSHRTLRLSLLPPPTDALPPRPDEPGLRIHRRSSSGSTSKGASLYTIPASPIPSAPRAPPPTGPLPPTPHEPIPPVVSRHSSIKQRLRMRSTPSPAPSHISFSSDLSAPAHQQQQQQNSKFKLFPPIVPLSPVSLGEPITTMQNDPNFLSMSPRDPPLSPFSKDANFLQMSSPLLGTPPVHIPVSASLSPGPAHAEGGSPVSVELTSLSPPPRRGARQISTPPEKDKDKERPNGFSTHSTPAGVLPDIDDMKEISRKDSAVSLGLSVVE